MAGPIPAAASAEIAGLIPNPSPDPLPVQAIFSWSDEATGCWRLSDVVPAIEGAADTLMIRLYLDEAEGYYLNVTTDTPAIFVHWREPSGATDHLHPPEALFVTLSYNEAARLLDAGERVDSVPMPAELAAWLTEYVNLHYEPEQKKKKGGRNRPSFMKPEEFGQMVDREQGMKSGSPVSTHGVPRPGEAQR